MHVVGPSLTCGLTEFGFREITMVLHLLRLSVKAVEPDYIRPLTRHKYNSEPSLIYRTTRGKVELEHDLHSVYTVHSAL